MPDADNTYTCVMTLSTTVTLRPETFSYVGNHYFAPGTDRFNAIEEVKAAALSTAGHSPNLRCSIIFVSIEKAFLGL